MTSRALFPISVSNQRFSSERVSMLLPQILYRYDEIVFIVADHLQLYNKAMRSANESSLADVVREFGARQEHVRQRRRWLERLRRRLDPNHCGAQWTVWGVEDIADSTCFHIFRNVMVAYYATPALQKDVISAAMSFASNRQDIYPFELRKSLSMGYLLEELALSIRVKVLGKIWDEYYDGQHSQVMMKLYAGAYPVSVFDLAFKVECLDHRFRFFQPENSVSCLSWEECPQPIGSYSHTKP